jgi:hypothetical protein
LQRTLKDQYFLIQNNNYSIGAAKILNSANYLRIMYLGDYVLFVPNHVDCQKTGVKQALCKNFPAAIFPPQPFKIIFASH